MIRSLILTTLALATAVSFAAGKKEGKFVFYGSTTIGGVVAKAVEKAELSEVMDYAQGGSGKGETYLVNGAQGIAPMSRPMNPDLIQSLKDQGVIVTGAIDADGNLIPGEGYKLGMDGLSILVNKSNGIKSLTFDLIKAIYECRITRWEDPALKGVGSNLKGAIVAYRRDLESGTTSTFKDLTGGKYPDWGKSSDCTKEVKGGEDIKDRTMNEANAIGFGGLSSLDSAKNPKNQVVAVAAKAGDKAIVPSELTIRDLSYPMSRYLWIYEVSGKRTPNAYEQRLLETLKDPNVMDDILEEWDLVKIINR